MNQILFKLELLRYLDYPQSPILGWLPAVPLSFLLVEENALTVFDPLDLTEICSLSEVGVLLRRSIDHVSVWSDGGKFTFWTMDIDGKESEFRVRADTDVPWACRRWGDTVGIHFIIPGRCENYLDLIKI